MLDTAPSTGLAQGTIKEAFQEYQKVRQHRAEAITKLSNKVTREESYANDGSQFRATWLSPLLREYVGGEQILWP
jgi:2-polyprenyl-6-methoxyphenol hydroxylase-like FAD-dependent oxidoreductase